MNISGSAPISAILKESPTKSSTGTFINRGLSQFFEQGFFGKCNGAFVVEVNLPFTTAARSRLAAAQPLPIPGVLRATLPPPLSIFASVVIYGSVAYSQCN